MAKCVRCPNQRDRVGKLCTRCCTKIRDAMRRRRGYPKPRLGRQRDARYPHPVECRVSADTYAQLVQAAGPEPLGRVVRDALEAYLAEIG